MNFIGSDCSLSVTNSFSIISFLSCSHNLVWISECGTRVAFWTSRRRKMTKNRNFWKFSNAVKFHPRMMPNHLFDVFPQFEAHFHSIQVRKRKSLTPVPFTQKISYFGIFSAHIYLRYTRWYIWLVQENPVGVEKYDGKLWCWRSKMMKKWKFWKLFKLIYFDSHWTFMIVRM